MAYLLEFDEKTVVPYLLNLDLSRDGRIVLYTMLNREIRDYADALRSDPQRRLAANSDYFEVVLIFRDPQRKVLHRMRLIINDAARVYGILRVVYVEDFPGLPDL